METIEDIRHQRLLILLSECGGSITKLSSKIDKSYSQTWQWVKRTKSVKTGLPRSINSLSARHIERVFNREPGWMDLPVTMTAPLEKGGLSMLTEEEINSLRFDELIKVINHLNENVTQAKLRLSELLKNESGNLDKEE